MTALMSFAAESLKMILGVLFLTTILSFLTVFLAYGVGLWTLPYLALPPLKVANSLTSGPSLEALWVLPFHSPLTPVRAILIALSLGILGIALKSQKLRHFACQLRDRSTVLLNKVFIPYLGVYVFGVFLKLQYEGSVTFLFTGYGKVLALTYAVALIVLLLALALAARFSWSRLVHIMKNLWPATITVLSTMSSIASLPLLTKGLEKLMGSRRYPDFVVPLTINFHTFGDGLAITLSALALLLMGGIGVPSLGAFTVFTGYFCLARFFNACVPGGGILLMLPFIEGHLGLPSDLGNLITTLYILQDSLISLCNVLGNAAFALLTRPLFDSTPSVKKSPISKVA
jgi:Na+/H+-dicarboxylate symporter